MKSLLERHAVELGWEHEHPFVYASESGYTFSIIYNQVASQLFMLVNVSPLNDALIANLI